MKPVIVKGVLITKTRIIHLCSITHVERIGPMISFYMTNSKTVFNPDTFQESDFIWQLLCDYYNWELEETDADSC